MSREEVWKMIDDVDENKDGRLDYGEVRLKGFLKLAAAETKQQNDLCIRGRLRSAWAFA